MTITQAERNIKLYYLFQIFCEPLFWGAILITFISRVSGMTLTDIFFMESVCVIGLIVLDGPLGVVADMFGRRNTMLIGMSAWTIKLFITGCAINPLMIWLANIFWVFGQAMISGSDTSMLADSLKFLGRDNEFQKIEGRSNAYRLALIAVCAISVGYLAEINLRLPIFLGAPFLFIGCLAVYFMAEPPFVADKIASRKQFFDLVKLSVVFVYNHSRIKWIFAFSTLIAVVSKIWFFTYNPYFELVNLPLAYFGWMFFLLNVVAAICSHEAHRISKYLGDFGGMAMMVIFLAVPIWLMGFYVSQIAVLLILMQNVVRGFNGPFLGGLLHSYLDSENRATVASFNSMFINLGQFICLAVFGLILKYCSLPACLEILSVTTLIIGISLMLSFRTTFRKTAD